MKTASEKPDSVSMVNITPEAAGSERTIRCTPAERATTSVVEVVMYAVGNGSIVMQGGEHFTNRGQDLLDAAEVEECLLLSGEGGVRQILGCGARPDGEGQLDEVTYYYRERNIAAVVFTVDASTVTGHPSLSSEEIAEGAGKNADVLIPLGSGTRGMARLARCVAEFGIDSCRSSAERRQHLAKARRGEANTRNGDRDRCHCPSATVHGHTDGDDSSFALTAVQSVFTSAGCVQITL